jgi:glycosyltransferase involved in cell wall biosynthesis
MAMIEANSISGTAKAVLEFAKEAAHQDSGFPEIDLSILTFDRESGENSLARAIWEIGIPHDIVFERHRFDKKVIPQLRAALENRHTDLIWSNSVKSHFLVRWAGLNRSRRWVAFHHGYTTTDVKTRIYNQLDRWSLQRADCVITSSAAFLKELTRKSVHPNHIHVQHMPIRPSAMVSEEKKSELRHQLGLEDGTRVLLCVGRLSHEKGHADLIRAFPKMRELSGDLPLRLVVVGEGPERPRIERLRRSLNLTNSVTLTGQQDDIGPYYGIADVFVLPSLSEGCPNVLLEAMAARVPVVATEVGGIPEIVTNGRDAILIKRRDRDGLAKAAVEVLKDQGLRNLLVSSAREVVARKTPRAYFKSITFLFMQACANSDIDHGSEGVHATGETA